MTDRVLATMVRERDGKNWSLFVDRDGVINTRIIDGYVRTWSEFTFSPGAPEALAILSRWAPNVVVVTNQQGVGKALMTAADLDDIHARMREAVVAASGRIDAIQICPHLASKHCDCRKPKPGMATRYLDAHPTINGSLSVMVGDTESDIEMGRRLRAVTGGAFTVRIDRVDDALADATYASLADFAHAVAGEIDGRSRLGDHSAE